MYKGLLAVVVAAVCAAAVVGFIPPPAPAVAAVETAQPAVTQAAISATPSGSADIRGGSCAQAWPYYEASCLRDSRRRDGGATVARVVAPGNRAVGRAQQPHR